MTADRLTELVFRNGLFTLERHEAPTECLSTATQWPSELLGGIFVKQRSLVESRKRSGFVEITVTD